MKTTKPQLLNAQFSQLLLEMFGVAECGIFYLVKEDWVGVSSNGRFESSRLANLSIAETIACGSAKEMGGCWCFAICTPERISVILAFEADEFSEKQYQLLALFLEQMDARWLDEYFLTHIVPQYPEDIFLGEQGFTRMLNENSFEGLAIYHNGKLQQYNDAFATIFGFEPGNVVDVVNETVIHPEDRSKVDYYTSRNESYRYEVRAFHADGSLLWLEINSKNIPKLHLNAKLIAIRDITRRKELEISNERLVNRMHTILDGAHAGIISVDQEGVLQSINKEAETLFGVRAKDVIGKCYASYFFSPSFRDGNEEVAIQLFNRDQTSAISPLLPKEGVQVKDYNCQIQSIQGNIISVCISVTPLYEGEDKNLSGYVCVIRDVSELEGLLKTLNDNRLILSKTLENSKLGSWEYILEKNHIELSREAQNILRIGSEILTFSAFKKHSHPEDWPRIKHEFFAMEQSKSLDLDFRVVIDEEIRWLNLQGLVYYLPSSILPKFTGTIMDVTDRKNTEEELKEVQVKLEKAVKGRDVFLANMSHEIRTPLHAILGYAKLLKDKVKEPSTAVYAETIAKSGTYLLEIINEVLDFSKLESETVEFDSEPFELQESLGYVHSLFQSSAEEKGLKLVVHLPDEVPPVLGDKYRLNQVLTNLVGNAIKFTHKGSVTIEAQILSEEASKLAVLLIVRDTGIGVDEKKQQLIFESFSQENAETAKKFGGTGLGLSIVKNLVTRMGGEIWLASEAGKGSEFTVKMHFNKAAENDVMLLKQAQNQQPLKPIDQMNGLKVLMVEDNEVNQGLVKNMIGEDIASLKIVGNGKLALNYLENHAVDFILMDLQMPEMNGFDATVAIRNLNNDNQSVPIIALSADVIKGELDKCLKVGMNDYLAKPFTKSQLIEKLVLHSGAVHVATEPVSEEIQGFFSLRYIEEATAGNQDKKIQLLQLVATNTPKQLERVQIAIKNHDCKEASGALHQLKGTLGLIAPSVIFEKVKELEILCKSPEPSVENIHAALLETVGLQGELVRALNKIISQTENG